MMPTSGWSLPARVETRVSSVPLYLPPNAGAVTTPIELFSFEGSEIRERTAVTDDCHFILISDDITHHLWHLL